MTRAFLILAIVVYAIIGLGLLAIPAPFIAPFGVKLGAAAVLMARIAGSGMLLMAVTLVLMLNDTASAAGRAVLLGQALCNVVTVVVLALAVLSGQVDRTGWVLVLLDAILAAGFAWSWFDSRRS